MMRAETSWVGQVGTGARLTSALRGWANLRYEVTEEASPGNDGGRWSHTPDLGIFDTPAEKLSGWPQWNDEQEKALQHDLLALSHMPAHEARKRVLELEKAHALRRELVWAELGESPLALAAKHLTVVAEVSKTALAAGSVADLQAMYATQGWRADDAVPELLAGDHFDEAPRVGDGGDHVDGPQDAPVAPEVGDVHDGHGSRHRIHEDDDVGDELGVAAQS